MIRGVMFLTGEIRKGAKETIKILIKISTIMA
jgi:hypothetical protein